MSDYIKKVIDTYRDKTAIPSRSEVVSFRVTPEELDLLMQAYGSYTGIRDFALASTDANFISGSIFSVDASEAEDDQDKA